MRELLDRAAEGAILSYRDLHIILDAVPTPISWATLPDQRIKFMNRSLTRTFGYRAGDLQSIDEWIETLYPRAEDRVAARTYWEELRLTEGVSISEGAAQELEIRCADGSLKTVQHRGIMLHEISVGIATFEDITDRKRAEDALRRIALEDVLTGLPNRRQLQERWLDEMQTADPFRISSLLLIDLDGFKAINDRLGHDAGDAALVAVADRLRESVRAGDFVCRIGGDEFVVLLPGIHAHREVEQVCWRIGASLSAPIHIQGRVVSIGASIGASLYPQDGDNLQELMKRADEAMYRRKADRKGGWEWFRVPYAA
ncbi:sensor domain-containing diguanylate cyclase [Mesorhizobium sp. SB112]|uniref:sensor domain-containing diguanylate cyclase n=1 Tax=Mesorhizobium sp. SB112 TaxID=3151853 RepID=UPI0032670694